MSALKTILAKTLKKSKESFVLVDKKAFVRKKQIKIILLDVSVFIFQECSVLISTNYKVLEAKQEGMENKKIPWSNAKNFQVVGPLFLSRDQHIARV